jgi:hypothetical protein
MDFGPHHQPSEAMTPNGATPRTAVLILQQTGQSDRLADWLQ